MASKLNYATSTENAELDAKNTDWGNACTMELRDGTQPAGPATAATGTLGATFTLGSPFAPSSSGAVQSPTLPANVNGVASITPTWGRIKTSGGTAKCDFSVATSGADMNISGSIVNGQPVSITSWTISQTNHGH